MENNYPLNIIVVTTGFKAGIFLSLQIAKRRKYLFKNMQIQPFYTCFYTFTDAYNYFSEQYPKIVESSDVRLNTLFLIDEIN